MYRQVSSSAQPAEGRFKAWAVGESATLKSLDTPESIPGLIWYLVIVPDELPKQALNYLPLRVESYSSWEENSDLFCFVDALFNEERTLIGFNKRTPPLVTRPAYARTTLIPTAMTRLELLIADFNKMTDGVDVRQSPSVGGALKYSLAWEAVVVRVLEEAKYFSVAHLLDAERDLECSVKLAAGGYYKQSIAVLRLFLESVVMPIHFCSDHDAFRRWRHGSYKTPSRFSGPGGLLADFVCRRLISSDLAHDTSSVYGALSAAIHGTKAELDHGAVFAGNEVSLGFSYKRLERWCRRFMQTADVALKLLFANLAQWDVAQPDGLFCDKCHNAHPQNFDVACVEFGDRLYDRLRCNRCGSVRMGPLRLAQPEDEIPWEFPGVYFSRNAELRWSVDQSTTR
jgi:hypothetical protein